MPDNAEDVAVPRWALEAVAQRYRDGKSFTDVDPTGSYDTALGALLQALDLELIDGENRPMIRTFETEQGRWVVSKRGYGWLPGIYESKSVARQAASFPVEVLTGLGCIYRIDGEDRPVTADDLQLIDGGDRET